MSGGLTTKLVLRQKWWVLPCDRQRKKSAECEETRVFNPLPRLRMPWAPPATCVEASGVQHEWLGATKPLPTRKVMQAGAAEPRLVGWSEARV